MVGIGVAVALVAAGVWAVRADRGNRAESRVVANAECESAPVPPRNVEVNTFLDTRKGLLEYRFSDPATGEQRSGMIDYRNCRRPALKRLIAHALDAQPRR